MTTVHLEIQDDLAALLGAEGEPIERAALDMIVLELYRRRTISSGKAAELLAMRLEDFIVWSSKLGIPFFDMSKEAWEQELRTLESLR